MAASQQRMNGTQHNDFSCTLDLNVTRCHYQKSANFDLTNLRWTGHQFTAVNVSEVSSTLSMKTSGNHNFWGIACQNVR